MRQTHRVAVSAEVGEFRSRTAQRLALYGALLPSLLIVGVVVGGDLPLWALVFVPVPVAFAVVLVARQVLRITADGVTYCNGIVRHHLSSVEVGAAVLQRPAGYFGWYGEGVTFTLARYPDATRPVAAGPVALATVCLAPTEQARLVAALTELLGRERTEALTDWG